MPNLCNLFLRVGRTDLYQIWGHQRAIIEFIKLERESDTLLRCFVSKPQRVKGQILHFLTPCVKIKGDVGQISKSIVLSLIHI